MSWVARLCRIMSSLMLDLCDKRSWRIYCLSVFPPSFCSLYSILSNEVTVLVMKSTLLSIRCPLVTRGLESIALRGYIYIPYYYVALPEVSRLKITDSKDSKGVRSPTTSLPEKSYVKALARLGICQLRHLGVLH